jgi:transposase InsO family protein
VQAWIKKRGFKTCFIKPGSPWQNAYIESFNSRFRDEFLNMEVACSPKIEPSAMRVPGASRV